MRERERKIPSGRTASLLIVLAKLEDEDDDEEEVGVWGSRIGPCKGPIRVPVGHRACMHKQSG